MDPTVIVGYTTDSNVVGYSHNDFIWASITDPNLTNCPPALPKTLCQTSVQQGDSKCANKEYCKNKLLANKILAAQSVHTGADIRFFDTKNNYNMQLLTTINLGVGIIGIGLFIFYNQ